MTFASQEERQKYGPDFCRQAKIVLSLLLTGKAFHRLSEERGTRTIPLEDVETIKKVMQVMDVWDWLLKTEFVDEVVGFIDFTVLFGY